jgi:arylsulfatase A-like enzyme
MRPNVLLVVFDTARADALEPYGAPSGSTPTVAQLARSGQVVSRAYATAC